jgi:hypothetical protein
MIGDRFDALTRLLTRSVSRRSAIRTAGGAGAAAALLGRPQIGATSQATPAAADAASVQAFLDSLDPETRDSIARALWLPELQADTIPADLLAPLMDVKNSNAAFGARLGAHLLSLIAEPTSFLQSQAERYETLLTYCQSLSPHQAYIGANLIGVEASKGYEAIVGPANLQFPQANAIRLKSQLGWYFFVGTANDASGQEYGIELMFFRYALLPPDLAAGLGLTDTENQIIELHFSVSKAGGRHYQAKPIVIAGTTGMLSFDSEGLGATMGKNVIRCNCRRMARMTASRNRSRSRWISPSREVGITCSREPMAACPVATGSVPTTTRSRV